MENIITTTIVTESVNKAIAANDAIKLSVTTIASNVERYNAIKLGDDMTEDEIKAGGLDTISESMNTMLETLNHDLRIATYEALYAIQPDALPAILLGSIKQYTIKDVKAEDSDAIIRSFEEKLSPFSVKNYDTWAKKTKKNQIVHDPAYFAMADTLAYYMLEGVAHDLGVTITNYKFVYGLDKGIERSKLVGTKASKTTILGELQKCLDALYFVARDDGKNTHRAISKDVTYLQQVVTSAGKNRLELKAIKAKAFLPKVEDVMFRIVANQQYSIAYAQNKAK